MYLRSQVEVSSLDYELFLFRHALQQTQIAYFHLVVVYKDILCQKKKIYIYCVFLDRIYIY